MEVVVLCVGALRLSSSFVVANVGRRMVFPVTQAIKNGGLVLRLDSIIDPRYNLQCSGEMLVGLSRRKSDGRNTAEHAVAAAVIALGLSELGPTGRGRELENLTAPWRDDGGPRPLVQRNTGELACSRAPICRK